jgi:hypothetical protein
MENHMSFAYTGQVVQIPAGKQVIRNGVRARQTRDTTVTVRNTAPARNGKTRIFWKSNGYVASALV